MSLASKIATLEQKQQLAVWKKTSSPTDRRVIRKNITNYLCEHTKKGVDAQAAIANNHPNWLKQGVDYLSKEEAGRLHAYGFLREDVMRHTGQIPHKLKNDDLVEACLQVWEKRLSRKDIKRVAHKYVLSLRPELCELMAKTGHSADKLLDSAVRETMRRFREKYYPNQKIGYLMGVHHDKAHIHAHVMLFPTTSTGKLLRVTDESRARGNRTPFQDMLKFATKAVYRFYAREIKGQSPASTRSPSRYMQSKLLACSAWSRVRSDSRLEKYPRTAKRMWLYRQYEDLLNGGTKELRKAMKEAYQSQDKLFAQLLRQRRDSPESFGAYKTANLKERAKQARELMALHEEKNKLWKKIHQQSSTKHKLFKDMSQWCHYRFNRGSFTEGGNGLRDPQVANWLVETMARSSQFGALVRDYVAEKQAQDQRIELPKQYLRLLASEQNPVAAEKFIEKDRFARKCIEYSAGKIVGPAFSMLDHYYRQEASLSKYSQKDLVREFLEAAIKLHKEELKVTKERAHDIERRIRGLRIDQAASRVQADVIDAAERGRRPSFLEEFRAWQIMGTEIPLDSLETIKLGRKNKYKPEIKKSEADFRTEISRNLQKLREQRMAYDELIYHVKVPKPPKEVAPGVGAGDVNQTATPAGILTKEADQEIVTPVPRRDEFQGMDEIQEQGTPRTEQIGDDDFGMDR